MKQGGELPSRKRQFMLGAGLQHLYLQIYLTVLASLLLLVIGTGGVWYFVLDQWVTEEATVIARDIAATALPSAEASNDVQRLAVKRLSEDLKLDLALFDSQRALIASSVRSGRGPLPAPESARRGERRHGWSLQLSDGRWLVVRFAREKYVPRFMWLGLLVLAAFAVGVAAYPLVRLLTRRLERLETSVEALGAGDLSARVQVHGHDEVARLAASFNRAAARIESLVNSQRMLLANVSHELRTPLARVRMGVELVKAHAASPRRAELESDIAELNQLLDEILFASRLEAMSGLEVNEEIDILALAAEECARYENCSLEGKLVTVRGDSRLLRRMIRNVLENAKRHAPGSAIEVSIVPNTMNQAEIQVRDYGAGIPTEDRERVFAPFYRSKDRPASGSIGLGLALVREIARRHGGDAVSRAPASGKGATIVVRLPSIDSSNSSA